MSRILRSIILGAPGSGKGTIAERIVKDFGFIHLSTGDVLRSQIARKTAVGLLAKSHIHDGSLVPDDVMVNLISSELEDDKVKHHSLLLDGFPRTLTQAEHLQSKHNVDVVISLNVPFQTIIDRIKGRWVHVASGRVYHDEFNPPKNKGLDDETGEPIIQRDDDRPETVLARLETFQKLTEPVKGFYRQLGILQEFKGNYSNEIWPHVHACLSKYTTPLQYTKYGSQL